MGFGTTFGGMGAASQGMDDAAQAENQRMMAHQMQQANAMRYRQMQEQDVAIKQARAANKAMMDSMPDPTGTLPQVNGGSVIPAPVKPQAAPVKTTGGTAPAQPANRSAGKESPSAAPKDYSSEEAVYRQLLEKDKAALKALQDRDLSQTLLTPEQLANPPEFTQPQLMNRIKGYEQGLKNYASAKTTAASSGSPTVQGKVTQGRMPGIVAGTLEEQAANTASESALRSQNMVELTRAISAAKDPKVRAVLEAELANIKQQVASGAQVPNTPFSAPVQQTMAAPTGQPAQATAEPQSPFLPKEAAQAYGGPNIDQSMQQLQQVYKLLKLQAANAYDPAQQSQLMMQMQEVSSKAQDLQIQQLGRTALFQPQALTQLVGLFAGQNGIQLAAQQDGKGNVRLAMPDGTPAPGEWGKPMTLPTLVDAMQSQLSQGMRAQAAQRAAALQGVSDKANAEEGAKGRWKMAETDLAGRNAALVASISGDARIQAELAKANITANDVKSAEPDQNVPGRYIIRKGQSAYLYDVPANNDPSKPAVAGRLTMIPNPV